MWKIYDELIAAVPEDLRVRECLIGMHWTLMRSEAVGMALTPSSGSKRYGKQGGSIISGIGERISGMPVRKVAEFVKSWDPYEAALGLAAINSAFNSPGQVQIMSGRPAIEQPQISAFLYYGDLVRGKKVTVVGHFPDLEELSKICQLTILERNPGEGDLPDPACEYVLPSQDYVFITGTSLINKTLPRLLQLSETAHTFLVGPSTPFAPLLFRHGIQTLAGTVVIDPDSVWQAAQEGAARGVFDRGARMVKVSEDEWKQNRCPDRVPSFGER